MEHSSGQGGGGGSHGERAVEAGLGKREDDFLGFIPDFEREVVGRGAGAGESVPRERERIGGVDCRAAAKFEKWGMAG